jgi:hypothetical protein
MENRLTCVAEVISPADIGGGLLGTPEAVYPAKDEQVWIEILDANEVIYNYSLVSKVVAPECADPSLAKFLSASVGPIPAIPDSRLMAVASENYIKTLTSGSRDNKLCSQGVNDMRWLALRLVAVTIACGCTVAVCVAAGTRSFRSLSSAAFREGRRMKNCLRVVPLLTLLVACSTQLPQTPTEFSGSWGGINAQVYDSTAAKSIVVGIPCHAVLIPKPVQVYSNGDFYAPGTVFASSDGEFIGWPASISGHISNNTLALDVTVPNGLGGTGTGHFTLTAGRPPTWQVPGCVA